MGFYTHRLIDAGVNGLAPTGAIALTLHNGEAEVLVSVSSVRSGLSGQDRNNPTAIAERMSLLAQRLVDGHDAGTPGGAVALTDPEWVDDPLMQSDPALPYVFWADANFDPVAVSGNSPVWLVSREMKITCTWSPDEQVYRLNWRSAHRPGITL